MGTRVVMAVALLLSTGMAMLGAGQQAAAQGASGLSGNSYTDPGYGFTIEWDGSTFEAEEMSQGSGDPYGVYLTAEGITGSVAAAGYADPTECLDDRVAEMETLDGVTRFRESSTIDPPDFERDITGAVYQYTYENPQSGNTDRYATFFGCEPLLIDGEVQPDVVLSYDFGTGFNAFDDLTAEWVPIIDGLQFAGESGSDSGSTDEPATGGISGNTYVDPNYAFSVTWDEDAYESSELVLDDGVPFGVSLIGENLIGRVYSDEYSSPRRCVSGVADFVSGIDGMTELELADDLELPDSDPDARVAAYRYTYVSEQSGGSIDFVQYIECRDLLVSDEPVEGVFLIFSLGVPADAYESSLPDLEDLLGSVEFDVTAGSTRDTDADTGQTGVDGNRYLDADSHWAVTWDDTIITGENWAPADGGAVEGVFLTAESGTFMTIVVSDATSTRRCLTGQVDAMEGDVFSGFAEVEDQELPESSTDARAALYEGTFNTSDGDEVPIYLYVECRPLIVEGEEVEDQFLVVNMVAGVDAYADDLDIWSEVLTSIEFDAGGATPDEPDNNGRAASGIDGNTYTSSIGYQLSWDDSVYVADLLDESNPDLGVSLSSDGSFLTFMVVIDPSAEGCLEVELGSVEDLDGMSQLSPSREDGPTTGRDSAAGLYEGVLTFDSGNESDVFVYLECRPVTETEQGTFFMVIRMVGVASAYADELPAWQQILDSIEFFAPE